VAVAAETPDLIQVQVPAEEERAEGAEQKKVVGTADN
jgi:hypothetical protein